jgi:uncharacterized protein YjbJ (UPF0337 family)
LLCGPQYQLEIAQGGTSGNNKASNQVQNLKGKLKETVGTAIGDDHMRAEGKMDQRKAAQKGVGEKVKDAASKLK